MGYKDIGRNTLEYTKMHTNTQKYTKAQKAWVEMVDLRVGDAVKVLRNAKDRESGWGDTWVPQMDKFVGEECIVKTIDDNKIRLEHNNGISWSFPFFILQKIGESLPKPIRLPSGDYKVEFGTDGKIKVGCQDIPFYTLEKIYNTAKSTRQ